MDQRKDGLNDTGFEQAGGTAPKPRLHGGPESQQGATAANSAIGGSNASVEQTDGDDPARPGGRPGNSASADMGPAGMESATPGPMGAGGSGERANDRGGAALGASTYNDRGDVTGPDGLVGEAASRQDQGDDLANRLGGGSGAGAGMAGGGAASGAMSEGRSDGDDTPDPDAAGVPSGGDPGGMGGVRAQGGAGRPAGGVSPLSDKD